MAPVHPAAAQAVCVNDCKINVTTMATTRMIALLGIVAANRNAHVRGILSGT
jgi:hypothetical protein